MTKTTGVTIATISFHPEITGTGQVLTDLAEALSERGMEVDVFTAQPHYYRKHDAVPRREYHKGIRITRIFSTTFDKNGRLGRIANWSSFALSAFAALLFHRSKHPILLVSSPPVLPFIGWPLKLLCRKRVIVLVHDVYPDIGVQLGYFRENGPTVRLWNFLNRLIYGKADRIVALAADMASVVAKKLNGAANKLTVIHNWADENQIQPIRKTDNLFLRENAIHHSFLVQYAGNMGFNHDLEPLIFAAKRLAEKDVGFLFIGEGGKKEKLQTMVEEGKISNVRFFPFQPRERLAEVLASSDLSVVTLEKGVEGFAVPSKFYSILASGRPILAILGGRCEMAELIRQYHCGFVIKQGDPDAIVRVIEQCQKDPKTTARMGENARRCFEENFTRDRGARRYQELIEGLKR